MNQNDLPPSSESTNALARLKSAWDARGRSRLRDFFVASHPGWNDPREVARQAALDAALILTGIDDIRLKSSHLLEIGCGAGRLAGSLADRSASYTGIDIAPSMIDAARHFCAGKAGARFLVCDGASLPETAMDRPYDLVIAFAVFIHVPEAVMSQYVAAAFDALRPGGQLRFQCLVDPLDEDGYASPEATKRRRAA